MRTIMKQYIILSGSILFLVLLTGCTSGKQRDKFTGDSKGTGNLYDPEIPFPPRHYVCFTTDEPVTIDGILSESFWEEAEWTDDFIDIEGGHKPVPRFRTRVKMLWDRHYFYIAAELQEPHVWATLKQRDTVIFYDNDFEVFIDPDGDTHMYYEFEMNAFGTEWDLFLVKPYRDGGPAINGWNITGLKTGVEVYGTINDPGSEDEKWTLEIAMPWKILKECAGNSSLPENGDQWRVNFSRVEWQIDTTEGKYTRKKDPETGNLLREDNWVWSPQGKVDMHAPETWGFVQFSERTVFEGTDTFYFNREEDVKWVLRQLYYKQRSYLKKESRYAGSLDELGLQNTSFKELPAIPQFFICGTQYEIIMPGFLPGITWHIDNEGRTWKTTGH
ncbi:MAG: carbohydrate-binding family 9-like protein [Bacteroidales bacterium]|nr:MAG: carbohydrate-binding family 9-like protein [Bacteroidales bacterium]